MTEQERIILENCHIHYENDTLEKEIALRVITETRKQFKGHLEKKRAEKSLGSPMEEYGMGYKDGIDYILDEIINELSKED